MITKNERENIFNHGWVESYIITDYKERIDDVELLKIAASTIYQKDSNSFKNINKLKDRLMVEGAMNTPSRVLEFIPRIINLPNISMNNEILNFLKYCTVEQLEDGNFKCYTNMRNICKNLPDYASKLSTPSLQGYEKFFIVKMFIPMFIRDQFMTHTQLSKLNRSYRVSSQEDNKYWVPDNFLNSDSIRHWIDVQEQFNGSTNVEDVTSNLKIQEWFKKLGYPKEIWTRFGTQNRYGEMIMAGWLNDLNGWQNFFLERGCIQGMWKNWVQSETRDVANIIYKQSQIGREWSLS